MFCEQCGKTIADGVKFCTNCGAPAPTSIITETSADLPQKNRPQESSRTVIDVQPAQTAQQPLQSAAPAMQPQDKEPYQPVNVVQTTQSSQQPLQSPAPVTYPQGESSQTNQRSDKTPGVAAKSQSPVLTYITLAVATAALTVAIIGGFVLPSTNQRSSGPKAVQAGTATIAIKAGEHFGETKILDENTTYYVVATSVGGDATFSDVMFNPGTGRLCLTAKKDVDKDTERTVTWVAYEE